MRRPDATIAASTPGRRIERWCLDSKLSLDAKAAYAGGGAVHVDQRRNVIRDRGNRIQPVWYHRTYRHLTILLDRLTRIAELDDLPSGDRLLDYGCGNKPYQQLLQQKFPEYIGADLEGNPHADIVLDAYGRIPAPDASFDCVLSCQVLEHTDDPRLYLREAFRVLKPGGSLVLSTPGIWIYHPDPLDYWRWTVSGLRREIERSGFRIVVVYSVQGVESAALQLWQDATEWRLPRMLRPLYTGFIQCLMGILESRRSGLLDEDAATFVLLARKPNESSSNPI